MKITFRTAKQEIINDLGAQIRAVHISLISFIVVDMNKYTQAAVCMNSKCQQRKQLRIYAPRTIY